MDAMVKTDDTIVETAASRRMSETEYERRRAELRELYGDSNAEAAAKRDQTLAVLFHLSGWTQEQLAVKEGKSQAWINYRLRFGRFLNFITGVINSNSPPKNLTEGRFRTFWDQTDKEHGETRRFTHVLRLMQPGQQREPSGGQNYERRSLFADMKTVAIDGKWHDAETIAKMIDATPEEVTGVFDRVRKEGTQPRVTCERKKVGRTFQYRMFKSEKPVGMDELTEKLGPIIEGLKAEGKKNMATISISAVARLAELLQRQLDEWSK